MKCGDITPAGDDPPKGVPLKNLLKKVQKMYVHFSDFLGENFKGTVVPALCDEIRARLDLTFNDLPALRCSLEAMLEPQQVLTKSVLKMILLKMLQNKHYFLQNETIPRWAGQPPVWTVIKVENADYLTIKEISFLKVEAHALTGNLAGEMHHVVLPIRYVRWLVKEMGYPRYERAHEKEIVGMVSWVRMETTNHGRTTFGKAKPSSSQEAYNRKLARARIEKDCPYKTMSCYNCPFGLERCGLATRQKTKEDSHEFNSSSIGP